MKYSAFTLLLGLGLVSATAVTAQETRPDPQAMTAYKQGANLLQTQPASVNRAPDSASPYKPASLRGVADSLQANPAQPRQASIIPDSAIPQSVRGLLPGQPKPRAVDPIDFFKVPSLEGGVRVPILRD